MTLWIKATGALKDRYSIWVARLLPSGPCRNPDLEMVIIKATSHDEQCMDYKNVQRVFKWLRTSPLYLQPLLYTLSIRMEKTRSWVVALKGLMLIHGVFCFDLPGVQKMGRLPFDLSLFSDGHVNPNRAWVYNAFVRAYFLYLDQKSAFVRMEAMRETKRGGKEKEESVMEELKSLEKLLDLIDLLLQVKPRSPRMNVVLVLEAMDCVMDEVLEVYEKFSARVHRVVERILDMGGEEEARVGLEVVRKAELQGNKMTTYFNFCKEIGILNVSDCPEIVRVDEKDIEELIRIRDGKEMESEESDEENGVEDNNCRAIVRFEETKQTDLKTVITEQWEVFEDDLAVDVMDGSTVTANNPFLDYSFSLVPYVPVSNNCVLPDLIVL
ncbi:putative clathrin assembly protein At1g25240 [Vigna radiata var. radiata]|uniref:Clathrin assembly protein At1g25240 n=1 Tax=Vigna radiata var. radiata TaxID=3916 RepID=A0A1S3VNX7_VIGRR|nr:putative clathrin assembly protein At1g25240 [Vigna radiata var. radiata]